MTTKVTQYFLDAQYFLSIKVLVKWTSNEGAEISHVSLKKSSFVF